MTPKHITLPQHPRKSLTIQVRVSPEEKKSIEAAAERAKGSVSEYLLYLHKEAEK